MNPVTLKKAHFDGKEFFIMSDGAVSNGCWAIRPGAVKNTAIFANPQTAAAALGIKGRTISTTFDAVAPGGELHTWAATEFVYTNTHKDVRVFQSAKTGAFAGIDRRILAVVGLDESYATVFGKDDKSPFMDAATIADAAFIAMPFKIAPFPTKEAK